MKISSGNSSVISHALAMTLPEASQVPAKAAGSEGLSISSVAPPLQYSRRRVFKSFFAVAGIGVLTRIFGLALDILARRALGPSVIGQIGWNAALLGYLGLLANPGMLTIAKRDLARRPSDAPLLTSLVLTIQLAASVAVILISGVILLAGVRSGSAGTLLVIQSFTLMCGISFFWLLESQERLILPSVVGFLTQAIQLPLIWLWVRSPADGWIYAALPIPLGILSSAVTLHYANRHGLLRLSALRPTLMGARQLMYESWPITLSTMATSIYYFADAFILGLVYEDGDRTVGIYATAYSLTLMPLAISRALVSAYFPSFARATDDPSEGRRVTDEFLRVTTLLGLPIALSGFLIGSDVVRLLFGAQYAESGPILRWLSLNIAFIFINVGLATPMQAMGRQQLFLRLTVLAAAFNLVANSVAIPIYGVWGAVVTTIGSEAVVIVAACHYRRSWLGMHYGILLWPILWFLAIALVSMSAGHVLRLNQWWTWAMSMVLGGAYLSWTLGPVRRRLTSVLRSQFTSRLSANGPS